MHWNHSGTTTTTTTTNGSSEESAVKVIDSVDAVDPLRSSFVNSSPSHVTEADTERISEQIGVCNNHDLLLTDMPRAVIDKSRMTEADIERILERSVSRSAASVCNGTQMSLGDTDIITTLSDNYHSSTTGDTVRHCGFDSGDVWAETDMCDSDLLTETGMCDSDVSNKPLFNVETLTASNDSGSVGTSSVTCDTIRQSISDTGDITRDMVTVADVTVTDDPVIVTVDPITDDPVITTTGDPITGDTITDGTVTTTDDPVDPVTGDTVTEDPAITATADPVTVTNDTITDDPAMRASSYDYQ